MTLDCEAYARDIFSRIGRDFPHLTSTTRYEPRPFVAMMMNFERQLNLQFDVTATLQSGDELGLGIGEAFWYEWFPAGDECVRNKFEKALRGILSGEMRVVECHRSNRVVKAQLQEPDGDDWNRLATWSSAHFPWPLGRHIAVLQNNHQGIIS